ncbi:histidine kinase [Cohnella sp. 56]|uniref:histidine kinase n=1 Tax=Cohnella sp. 56 TaxID=3113722 RepID=UPI0030E8A787
MDKYWIKLLAGFMLITALPIYWLVIDLHTATSDSLPSAERGTIDLRRWDFERRGALRLNGVWELYPGQLLPADDAGAMRAPSAPPVRQPADIKVPGDWNGAPGLSSGLGAATYRLRLLLPSDTHGTYGIRMTNIRMSSAIYVNGEPIGASGRPGLSRADTVPGNTPFAGYFTLNSSAVDIVVHTANFSYSSGGIVLPVWFGLQSDIVAQRESALFEYWLTAGGFLIPALFFLLFYRLRRREAPLLHIGAFCAFSLVYVLTHGEKNMLALLPHIPYEAVLRIQLISSNFVYYFLARYVVLLYPQFGVRLINRSMIVIVVALTAVGLFMPTYLFSRGELLLLLFALSVTAYIVHILIRAILARSAQALVLAISLQSILCMLAVYLLYGFGRMESQTLLPYEIICFVVSQAYLLVSRFADLLRHSERISERLLRLDEMKDEFMLNTSYQIREPLRTIRNMALSDRAPAAEPEREETEAADIRLSSIEVVARRLSYLVDDMIDYSLLKSGEVDYRPAPVRLALLLRSVCETLPAGAAVVPANGQTVSAELAIMGDAKRLGQIVYNLLDGASRHADGRGVLVSAAREGDRAVLTISASHLGGLWEMNSDEPLPGLPSAPEGSEAAEALRLSVTKRLIELGDGRYSRRRPADGMQAIEVSWPVAADAPFADERETGDDGRSDRRMTETAALMVAAAAEATERTAYEGTAARSEAAAVRSEGTVLIAGGDALGASVTAHLLGAEGIVIAKAGSGAETLSMLQRGQGCDLVIADLFMNDMSGLSLTRAIRERYALSELPVLLLSEGRRPDEALAAFQAGANDILVKPYDTAELSARVGTLLALRRSVRGLVRTETAFLQAQIKPHFLFNALNTIMTVCRLDPAQAETLLLELSRYLRASFDFGNLEQRVPLRKELELVRSYLAIEQARFGERLRIVYEIEAGPGSPVPPLAIQPLVENAVRHGIMKKPEGGTVRISVTTADGGCAVTVSDDGVGIPAQVLADIGERRETGGVGLINIGQRLKLLYGSKLHVESWPGEGTRVSYWIPGGVWDEGDTD